MIRWSPPTQPPQPRFPSGVRPTPVLALPRTAFFWVGIVVVLLIGAALRLIALDQVPPGLSHDEAYIGVTALEVWLLGRREVFFDIYNGIEPIVVYWHALYLRLLGIGPVSMRLVSVTAGLLIIALSYPLTRRLLTQAGLHSAQVGALLTALGVSYSFWAVFVSRLALRAVTLPLLELPALYFLWRGFVSDQSRDDSKTLTYFALGGACMGAAMYTYLSSRFLPFVPILFFVFWLARGQVRREHWVGMIVFFTIWGVIFAPLGLYFINHPDVFSRRAGQVLNLPLALAGDLGPLITHTLRTLGMFSLVGADTSRYGLAGRPLFDPLGAVLFHIGLIVSLIRLQSPARQSAPYAFLLIWWLVMLIPDFITSESPHFLRTIGALPPTYVFWALGILSTGKWLRSRAPAAMQRLAVPVLALYLAASGFFTVRDYFGRWANDAEARAIYGADFTEIAHYLDATDLIGPVALSAPYYRDWDRFRLDLQMHHNPPFVVWFDGTQAFLLPPPGSDLEPVYVFPDSAPPHPLWLSFLRLETQGTEMSVYRLKPEVKDVSVLSLDPIAAGGGSLAETEASSTEIVQLLGYRLEGEARAGDSLHLLLHWQPLQDVPGDPDYAFFVHLRDRHGYTWAQVDATGYAVVDWQPGVQVLQWLELPLPPDLPPLTYSLIVGLEDRGAEQPALASVELGTIVPSTAAVSPTHSSFAVPNPSQLPAGEFFMLRGHSLDPRFLQKGASTHVTLFWQAQSVPDADYTLTIWLVSESGDRIDLGERRPLAGDYPTSRWNPGQWVRDRFDLALPLDLPTGLYQVFAGWHAPSGAWLKTEGEPGLPLGEIFIAE